MSHLSYPKDPMLLKLAESARKNPYTVYALAKELAKNLTLGDQNV